MRRRCLGPRISYHLSVSCVCCSCITKTGFSILSRSRHPAVPSGSWSCWTCGQACTCMGVTTLAWGCRLGCSLSCSFWSPVAFLKSEHGFPSLAPWLPWFTIASWGISSVLFLAWYPLPFPAGFPLTACVLAVLYIIPFGAWSSPNLYTRSISFLLRLPLCTASVDFCSFFKVQLKT